jgi:hypothetical protein
VASEAYPSWGTFTKREDAIVFLRELDASNVGSPVWVSLGNKGSEGYELRISSVNLDRDGLKRLVEKHKLLLKEDTGGILVIY